MNAPQALALPPLARAVDRDTHFEIERFLVREARLLDEERAREWWQTCLTEDIHYQLPVWELRARADRGGHGSHIGSFVFNDDYQMLDLRIRRLETGLVWMEDPPNRIRRFIANVDAYWSEEEPGAVAVRSNFIVYRNRRQRDETIVWGAKDDRLRRVDGAWKLARRVIHVDQRVVLDKNLYFFI